MSRKNASVVLVHGGWADGSCWSKVIGALQPMGITVLAAPLPLTSLPDDVSALDRTLERVEEPVVLVGHAYAGAVIGSTRAQKVASLVYVAALAPNEGETVATVFFHAAPHPLAPKMAADAHGFSWLPEEAFAAAFAQHASAREHGILAAVQRPLSLSCTAVAVGRPLWKDRPTFYLIAEDDRMIVVETQRFMADRMKAHVHTAPVDHAPMVSAPEVVVKVIQEAMQAVA